jgi:hypothetical protein
MGFQLLGHRLVVKLLVAADLSVNGQNFLHVLNLLATQDVVRTSSQDVDLNKQRITKSSF